MSSQTPPNSLGLSGVPSAPPSLRSFELREDGPPTVPSVNVEASGSLGLPAGQRAAVPLGSSASEPIVGLAAHSRAPRRSSSPHSSLRHELVGQSAPDARHSAETSSPPRHNRILDSPRLKGVVEGIKAGMSRSAPASDPGHTERTKHPSPRWPLRPLLHLTHSRQEPFLPQNPYAGNFRDLVGKFNENHWLEHATRETVLALMLRLPSTYFSRVARVFRTAELSKGEVDAMIKARCSGRAFPRDWNEETAAPSVLRFRTAWDDFLRSLEKEWKTLNIVSALLTTGILTLFQIEEASNNLVTRTFALISMISALMSLIFGCTLIVRFGTMKGIHKAIRWAEYMQTTLTASVWWNVWILLATPAIWLAYSIIAFCIAMLAFVWTTGTDNQVEPPSTRRAIGPRVVVTVIFALGLWIFFCIIRTFRSWADDVVYVRNPNDHFDTLENAFQDNETKREGLGNHLDVEQRV